MNKVSVDRAEVALFDVDGTLVDAGGAGRRAISRAADQLYGRPDLFDEIRFDGATDRSLCRSALGRLDGPVLEAEIDRLLSTYLAELGGAVAAADDYRVLPGVSQALSSLAAAGVLLGLGTGNVEAGARIKLARGDLNAAFGFGGFGDDHEMRAEILRAGLERARRALGRPARRAWIVGDTPLDLAAGREVGAGVVLVATGRWRLAELQSLGPDLCVESLADPRLLAWAEG